MLILFFQIVFYFDWNQGFKTDKFAYLFCFLMIVRYYKSKLNVQQTAFDNQITRGFAIVDVHLKLFKCLWNVCEHFKRYFPTRTYELLVELLSRFTNNVSLHK